MKNTPNQEPFEKLFENLKVIPIESGYLIEVQTEFDEIRTAATSWRQALRFLKGLEQRLSEDE